MHGDETTGYILMMHLIDSLLSGYGTVPRITNLIHNYQIYINPLANPDGTYHGGNNTVFGSWRGNANGIDLNRNYPDPKDGPHPDGNAWQDETKAFMHYDTIHHFVMSANFHGGSEVVNYPWDTWSKLHADDLWFQFISREFADTIHQYGPAGYFMDENNGITNGFAWYEINGGRQDYTTYFHYGRETTIELSYIKTLPTNQMIDYWNYTKRSLLDYIEESGYGINGQVTDTVTGEPLKVKINIPLHDIDNSFEYSDATNGWYYRPIAAGSWTLTFTCLGYFPKTISGINVTNRTTTRLNVRMVPLNFGINDKARSTASFLFPNPTNGNVRVVIPGSGNAVYTLRVFDMTGKQVMTTTLTDAGDHISYPINLTGLEKGVYLVKLDGGNNIYENKLILL
jgi:hypothetical protein